MDIPLFFVNDSPKFKYPATMAATGLLLLRLSEQLRLVGVRQEAALHQHPPDT